MCAASPSRATAVRLSRPVPPALRAPGAEVAPPGVVHQQRAAVDLGREELFQVGLGDLVAGPGRLADVERAEARLAPGPFVGLDDERRDAVPDRVAVHREHPVRALLVHEGQPGERVRGAEPDELGRRGHHARAEHAGEPRPHLRVRAVGRDHQVVSGAKQIVGPDRRGEPEVHAGLGDPLLEQRQQRLAGHGGHAVAAEPPPLPAQPHLDRIPVHAVLGQRAPQHRIGGVDAVQGGVGEHHAEAERVAGPVALEHGNLAARVAALGQQRGQQAAGATAEDRYPHVNSYMFQIIDERCSYDT